MEADVDEVSAVRRHESQLEMTQQQRRAEPIQELSLISERLANGEVTDPFEREALEHRKQQLLGRMTG